MKFKLYILVFSIFSFSFSNAQVNLNQGLVAYYPFNGNANDASGNNINGIVSNATLTTDKFGALNSAFDFNGSSSYIQLPYSNLYNFAPQDSFSISVLVLPDPLYSWPAPSVVVKSPPNANYLASNWNYGTYILNNKAMVGFANNNVLIGSTVFNNNPCWYNIVQTYMNGIWKLYVNGVLESQDLSQTKFILQDGSSSKIAFGKKGESFGDWYKGKMDEVRIYNRVLNQNEVNALSNCVTNSCNNWLNTQVLGQSVKIGDLDVSGTQITVEATINRTSPYVGAYNYAGDIVSKHTDPNDANYLLRPNNAEITTSNGYFITPPICDIQLNKTYHIALVYNGTTLKFYRNGFLMSQVAATGNLFQNNLLTTIGDWANYTVSVGTNFKGNINEVRIWNVAKTQAQLQTYMNSSLPNPTTQSGLLAYYVFDNLLNKQGNATFNGTLNGGATINATNPNCSFVADSCNIIPPPLSSTIINNYTAALALDICTNKLTVQDALNFNVGDTVLLIQMKGATIDQTNTSNFGTVTNFNGAGNYEFNTVKAITGNQIEFKYALLKSYNFGVGKVQLIRVPFFNNYVVTNTLTCQPWNGATGGVLVFNVANTLTLNSDINVKGKGFRGGIVSNNPDGGCGSGSPDYFYPLTQPGGSWATGGAEKGEGLIDLPASMSAGKGALGIGGGGGNKHNTGGGGGGNYGSGGKGGNELSSNGCTITGNGGIGGKNAAAQYTNGKIFLGGGGGRGDDNNSVGTVGEIGGGIVIFSANNIAGNNFNIIADGNSQLINAGSAADGAGGGGGGGSIFISNSNFTSNVNLSVKGGDGGSQMAGGYCAGPGGGGGGGVIYFSSPSIPASANTAINAGNAGIILNTGVSCTGTSYGAVSGNVGANLFNLVMPVSTIPFKPNIDSVRINSIPTSCTNFNFNGLAYTNTNPIATWQWFFGDGTNATGQNTTHNYTTTNTYTVKLIVTDINGCKDSISKIVSPSGINADAGLDTAYCTNTSITKTLLGLGGGTYSWSPSLPLNNNTLQNPTATITGTTKFYLTVTNALGCSAIDSVTITINALPNVVTLSDTTFCKNSNITLTTTGALSYTWIPASVVSNSNIGSPTFTANTNSQLTVTGTDANGCKSNDIVNITVKPIPVVRTIPDTTICANQNITLTTTGAQTYTWTPATGLNNASISNPIFSATQNQTYVVNGTLNGCSAKDTLNITVKSRGSILAPNNGVMCKNEFAILNGNNGTNNVQYTWTPNVYLSNNTIINPIATPPSTQQYNLLVKDLSCAFDTNFAVMVVVNPLPTLNVTKSNDIVCNTPTAKLNAIGAKSYTWSPTTFLSNANIANPLATPNVSISYLITGVDNNGCKNIDSIKLNVSNATGFFNLPNIFTPNKDGINDCFGISKWGQLQDLFFIIYNRWGVKVFETNNPAICWEGKYKGENASIGSYVYYITAKSACGEIVKKGSVLLVR